MSSGNALPPGSIFATDYRIIRPLAAGGMGAVYVAEQLSTGKQRALKLMHAELAWDARLRERFVQEARVGANIDSEHVVEVVGAGIDPASGTPWLAMELLDGVDLALLMQQRGPLPVGEVHEIMSQLCHALAAAHRSGIVHRDLKPQNIFVARSRQQNVSFKVKILDFGIAKVVAAARGTFAATSVVGTPLWMAPEQTDPNGVITPASDVWALGLIAFRMLTGRWYWTQAAGEASSVMMLMREVLFEPMVPASVRASQYGWGHLIPPAFDSWFARCLARDHRQRFQDAGEAMQALEAVFGAGPGYVAPPMVEVPTVGMPSGAGPHIAPGTTGGVTVAQTPAHAFDASRVIQPAPAEKRGIGLWIGMVLGITMLLLFAGGAVAFLALMAIGIDAGASKQSIGGTYLISNASNPGNLGSYRGLVTVQEVGNTYRVHRAMEVGPSFDGIGLVSGDVLGAAHAEDSSLVLAIYQIEGGTLWGTYSRQNAIGHVAREVLTGPNGLSGTYRLTHSDDNLSGDVFIKPNGSTFLLTRSSTAGGHQGTGIHKGDRLVVAWSPTPSRGTVVVYAYNVFPGQLDGVWASVRSPNLGMETLLRE